MARQILYLIKVYRTCNKTNKPMYETITDTLDMLDGKMSDQDFLAEVRRSRFLRQCKELGFERIKRLGLIAVEPKKQLKRGPASAAHVAKMTAKVKQVNKLREGGMMAKTACHQVGIPYQRYVDWSGKLGLKSRHRVKSGPKPTTDDTPMRDAVQAVNDNRAKGMDVKAATQAADVSYNTYYKWSAELDMRFTKPTS